MIKSAVGKQSLERAKMNYQTQKNAGATTTLGLSNPNNPGMLPPRNDRQALGVYDQVPPKMQDAPIDVNIIGNTKPIDITKSIVSNTAPDTQAKLGAATAGAMVQTPETPQAPATTEDKSESLYNRLLGNMGLLANKGDRTAELQEKEQLAEKKKQAKAIEDKYTKTEQSYNDRIDRLRESFQGTTGGADTAIRAMEQERDRHLSDIAVDYKIKQGAYTDAVELVDMQIDNEFAPLEDENKNLIALYGLVQNDLSESEQLAAQAAIREKEQATADAKQEARDAKLHQYNLTEIAARENPVRSSVAATPSTYTLQAGDDPYNVAQNNGVSIEELKKSNPQIKDWTNIQPGMQLKIPVSEQDSFKQKMLNSAGGKPLTDTPLQQINKGLTVLGQLGALQTNINNTKTGPILGLFKGANPWDTNAQTIKAQLNAVVPNLARGIYGEVGVLTDNDIANYSKTIGNLKSTNDVNNAIMYITLDLIGKSIKNTLAVQEAGGRDVSGFVEIYDEMEKTKSSILQTLPQSSGTAPLKKGYSGSLSSGLTFTIE